jgi:hypothetical protein
MEHFDHVLDEQGFLGCLLDGYAARGRFSHREHLHMAWSYLRRYGLARGADGVIAFIKHVAAEHGGSEKYNETVTRFWIRAVALALASGAGTSEFDEFPAHNPHLVDKNLPYRHWSKERLGAADAKEQWVEPDLLPLPDAARHNLS